MTDHEHTAGKAIGLDIGTSRIVTAQRVQKEIQFNAQLNAFVTMPYSKITEGVFVKEKIPYRVEGQEMIVFGNQAAKFANMFRWETRRPMTKGLLNPNEPNSLSMIKQILGTLIYKNGKPRSRKLCFSVPGPPLGSADDLTYHEATLRQALEEFGYEASSINEGLAVVLAELEAENYTGIGISFGGGMCNLCLACLSVPVFTFSFPKAGDFIDASAASVCGEGPTQVRALKEKSFQLNGHFSDKVHQALAVYYEDVIRSLLAALKDALAHNKSAPQLEQPIPIVIAGGSAMPVGFREYFEKALNETGLPVPISEVRMASDPLNTTAKGALIAALADA